MTGIPSPELRPIPGWEGLYSITADGRIWAHERVIVEARRIRRKRAHWMKLTPNSSGYLETDLCREGERARVRVHRIVCEVFNGAPAAPDLLVRHLDGNKRNNVPLNLAWGTVADNSADAIRLGEVLRGERCPSHRSKRLPQLGERNGAARLTAADALAIFNDTGSQRQIAARHDVPQSHVCAIKNGKRWAHVTGAPSATTMESA